MMLCCKQLNNVYLLVTAAQEQRLFPEYLSSGLATLGDNEAIKHHFLCRDETKGQFDFCVCSGIWRNRAMKLLGKNDIGFFLLVSRM